jgi:hypothetical protein
MPLAKTSGSCLILSVSAAGIPLAEYDVDWARDVLVETPEATMEDILGLPKNWILDE